MRLPSFIRGAAAPLRAWLPKLARPSPLAIAWALLGASVVASVAVLGTIEDEPPPDGSAPAAVAALPGFEPAEVAAQAPAPANADARIPLAPQAHAPEIGPPPAWRANARAIPPGDTRPRLAVIVGGLGLSVDATQAAIRLPPEITLAFVPYGRNVAHFLAEARAAGHEVLLSVPMEPTGYPADDPGPMPLLTSLPPAANAKRLSEILPLADMAVGLTNHLGGRFMATPDQVEPLLALLATRGLLFVEQSAALESAAMRIAAKNRWSVIGGAPLMAPEEVGAPAFAARLANGIERARKERGVAVFVEPHPYVLEALKTLPARLDRDGIMLAPVSALAGRAGATEGAALPPPAPKR